MPLGSATITTSINALTTKPAAGSVIQGRTNTDIATAFTNGTAAAQVTTVIDANVTSNNTAVALSTLTNTLGEAFTGLTKLKGIVVTNASTNNITTFTCNATGGPSSVTLVPGGSIAHFAANANGLTVTGTTTLLSNGNAADAVRVVLFLA
jgi:hypothetical protein